MKQVDELINEFAEQIKEGIREGKLLHGNVQILTELIKERNKGCLVLPQMTADCVARHLVTFHDQTVEERGANFAKPCEKCRHALKDCNLDWQKNFAPLLDQTGEFIQLCRPERFRRAGIPEQNT